MAREKMLETLIYLLQEEVECLRSVLSEWEHDKDCYTQYVRARIFRDAIEALQHKLGS